MIYGGGSSFGPLYVVWNSFENALYKLHTKVCTKIQHFECERNIFDRHASHRSKYICHKRTHHVAQVNIEHAPVVPADGLQAGYLEGRRRRPVQEFEQPVSSVTGDINMLSPARNNKKKQVLDKANAMFEKRPR